MHRDSKTIAIVSNCAWNIYNFRMTLMQTLRREGYEVIAIAPTDGYMSKITDEGFRFYDIELSPKGTNPIADMKTVWQLFMLYKRLKPLCVLQYTVKPNIYGNFAAFLARVSSFNTVTGLGTLFLSDNISSKIGRLLYRAAFIFSSKVFFQNSDDLSLFVDSGIVKAEKTALVNGSGVDTEYFAYSEKTKTDGAFIFLLIARMLWDKGVGEFVEAAGELRADGYDVVFRLMGSADVQNPSAISKAQIDEWVKSGLVEYLQARDDVRSAITESDCVVLPSYREGLPKVLLEASCVGRPLIATDAPGCRELVIDGVNGFLCKIKNSKDLALAMKKMILLPHSERVLMGERSRKMVCEKFSSSKVCEVYINSIKNLI